MKTSTLRFLSGATAGLCLVAGVAWGTCAGDENAVADWIFEPVGLCPGWALNAGTDKDVGNLGLTGGAEFSTNVPPVNCDCGHSLLLPGTNGVAGAVSIYDYDPLAGAEKFSILAWVRRDSADGANLSARIFSDTDSTSLTNTTSGVEFRFSGNAGNLALRINGTEVSGTVGGIAPTNGEWHHVAVVYDGTRAATNYATRNVHFYVDGIQRGVGSVLQSAVAATNYAPVVVGNASPSRTAANLLAGNVDNVMLFPGWAPEPAGNGNANAAIQCFMEQIDDIFPPYISAPADVEAEAGECLASVAVVLGTPTVGDDCMVAAVTNDAPETFPLGTNMVTWSVFDEAGNSSNSVQIVTVVPSRTGDCDEDGLTDYEEEIEVGTNSRIWDTDADGWGDGEEVTMGFNPMSADNCPKVTINAVLYNPTGTDAGKEWIELYSASSHVVDLEGLRLEVGRATGWVSAIVFSSNTFLSPGHCLLIGENAVTNTDLTAILNIPNAWTNEPTTGLRLVREANTNTFVLDTVFLGGSPDFNESNLETVGWLGTNSVWTHAGKVLERRYPGVDSNQWRDWQEVEYRVPRNSTAILDFDGDGLSDEAEWTGNANSWGEPTNPWNIDSDGDGLSDFAECMTWGTNPNTWASDGDIYPWMPQGTSVSNWPGSDSFEVMHSHNPLNPDENTNSIPDSWETVWGLANLDGVEDYDGDGVDNLSELLQNSNPLNSEDSNRHDYVVFFEASRAGWINKALDNDIGLGGWVNVRFLGMQNPSRICVLVAEGCEPEPFALRWFFAQEAVGEGQNYSGFGMTSALANGGSYLQVVDAGLHPDYEDTLGGEYAIDILTLDLTIWNGGNDLDNGQNQGSAGMVVPDDEEETPGAYLLVNWDDDDHDGYITDDGTWSQIPEPDLNENWVENEDNLAQLVPFLSPLPEMGTAELELLGADVGKVKLWTQSEKGTQIQLEDGKKTWNLSVASERAEFEDIMQNGCWIEGVAPGTIERGIEFVFRLKNVGGGTLCEDLCRATVVMLHLGNAVYRENLVNVFGQFPLRERCHTGIVFSFDGPLTSIGLTNAAHYGILQMQGLSPEEKLNGLTSDPNAEYWYCYTDTSAVADNLDGYRKRLQILCVAKWLLEKWTPNYCAFDCMNPCSSIWNGKLNDVKELRCDGLVELVYEFNGIMVWGKIVDNGPPHYDMRVSAFLEEHNDWQWGDDPEDWDWDMYGTFLPVTQGGFADDYIREHNPEYMGPNFRGALWDTTFHEQRVTVPEVLSPERHAHGSSLQ